MSRRGEECLRWLTIEERNSVGEVNYSKKNSLNIFVVCARLSLKPKLVQKGPHDFDS